MPIAPAAPAIKLSSYAQGLYRSTVQEAATGGQVLMGKLVAAARLDLLTKAAATRDIRERDGFEASADQLLKFEQLLCQSFPEALLVAFTTPHGVKNSSQMSVADVHFDQLELMDETQVMTSVALARVQQGALQLAEASLNDLNTLMSSVLGMQSVRAELNPLRPEAYVNALQTVLEQTGLPQATQLQWCNAMSAPLGMELHVSYLALCARLRKEGVVAVTYAIPSVAGAGSSAGAAGQGRVGSVGLSAAPQQAFELQGQPGPGQQERGYQQQVAVAPRMEVRNKQEVLLTLDKLRRLLSGELSPVPVGNRVEQFAAQFQQEYEDGAASAEGPVTDFDSTVPAALQALTDMKQVERVVQSLEQRRAPSPEQGAPQENTVEGQRLALRRSARNSVQALSLEVVTLMVENMAHDTRLLEPVRQVVRELEPALLRLSLVDPRFFTDKQHPARRLLQELTHRSLGFESSTSLGFDTFFQELQEELKPLFQAPVESAEVFEDKLAALQQGWRRSDAVGDKNRDNAVEALRHAEARNLLAEQIARGIDSHPDAALVPPVVIAFLSGPWAQVVAHARIKQGAGSDVAEKFEALIPAMLWSAHPQLARANPAKLTRVVPRLIATLREGLDTIHYPATRTSVFLEALMAIHQPYFRPSAVVEAPPEVVAKQPARARAKDSGNPWVAPEEAAASNFVELQDTQTLPEESQAPLLQDMLFSSDAAEPVATRAIVAADVPLGSWVEMWVNGDWIRTQLTWASPHGTLFLFTGAFGNTQSITRRARDKYLASGKLRLISGQPLVEGALDAVAQTAMRNSLDSTM
jgi:hypothetical protein